jgi:hypothetical protein
MTGQLPYQLFEQPKLKNQNIKSRPIQLPVKQTIFTATEMRASISKVLKGKPTHAQRVQWSSEPRVTFN